MPEEQTNQAGGGQETPPEDKGQEEVTPRQLLEQLQAIQAKQEELATVAKPPPVEKQEEKKVPEVTPPPPIPQGRVSRQDYDKLAAWAAEQRQQAERYRLAAKYGLKPSELEGEFDSPQAMEAFAHTTQLQKQVQVLEQRLEGGSAGEEGGEGAASPGATPPSADTGGPTGQQTERGELEQQYAAARGLGRTQEGRRALLMAIYSDPDARMGRLNDQQ